MFASAKYEVTDAYFQQGSQGLLVIRRAHASCKLAPIATTRILKISKLPQLVSADRLIVFQEKALLSVAVDLPVWIPLRALNARVEFNRAALSTD